MYEFVYIFFTENNSYGHHGQGHIVFLLEHYCHGHPHGQRRKSSKTVPGQPRTTTDAPRTSTFCQFLGSFGEPCLGNHHLCKDPRRSRLWMLKPSAWHASYSSMCSFIMLGPPSSTYRYLHLPVALLRVSRRNLRKYIQRNAGFAEDPRMAASGMAAGFFFDFALTFKIFLFIQLRRHSLSQSWSGIFHC